MKKQYDTPVAQMFATEPEDIIRTSEEMDPGIVPAPEDPVE